MSTLPSAYYDKNHIVKVIESGDHRRIIGGNWDTIGQLQLEFLIRQGLKPSDKLLDIGCGSLRLGVKAVPYLDEGNYWGTDLNESLLSTGYEKEIVPSGFGDRLSRSHLIADGEFEFPDVLPVLISQSLNRFSLTCRLIIYGYVFLIWAKSWTHPAPSSSRSSSLPIILSRGLVGRHRRSRHFPIRIPTTISVQIFFMPHQARNGRLNIWESGAIR